jgi:hypothetical protein
VAGLPRSLALDELHMLADELVPRGAPVDTLMVSGRGVQ